ncbi:MAG: hypothetical protein JWQ71_4837 [Pedosphaera sp.]|nr:hypothetical protein [Pedosphaera sp.]
MKKLRVVAGALSIIAITALIIFNSGCQKQESNSGLPVSSKGKIVSAEKNSFEAVTSQLDVGGNVYLYVSTEQWLDGLSRKVADWSGVLDSLPDVKDKDRENMGRVFGVVTNLIQQSGLEDVSGAGMSSIAKEKGFYRSKFILHHYPGKGTGFLWSMFGKQAHGLNGLDLLPATTAFATVSDLDLPLVWSVVEKEIGQSGIPGAADALDKLPSEFEKKTGLKLEQVLASLGGEYGLIVTLDESRKITVPTGQDQSLEFPEPGVVLVVKVKDETIFNRIDESMKKNKQVVRVDREGLKMRTMPVPLPLPIALRPTVAQSGGYLFIASTDALVEEVLAVKNGKKPGLKSTDEFKKLAEGMPQEGNQFSYVSQKFGQTWQKVQQQIMEKKAADKPAQVELMKKLMSLNHPTYAFNVSANTDQGWVMTGMGNQDARKMVLMPAVAVSGLLAAVAVPNFIRARDTSQRNACLNNLRQMDAAKNMWALENKKTGQDVPTWADLKPYLSKAKGTQLKCPSGGQYKLNAVEEKPTCSKTGHEIE